MEGPPSWTAQLESAEPMLLSDLLRAYVAATVTIRSIRTEKLFATVIKHYSEFLTRAAVVDDFSDTNLAAFMRHRRALGRADATVENEAIKLMVLWRWAAARRLCEPPGIRIERRRPETPHALLKHQIRALFRAASRATGSIGGKPRNMFFPALLGAVWDTAERISAVTAVERSDIDLRSREITYRVRKGRGRTITKPISRSTARAIRQWLEVCSDNRPFAVVGLTSIYYHLDRILVDAGIPPEKRNKFHALRKSHASYLHRAGGDATEALDHADGRVTRLYYLDPRVTTRRPALSLLFSPLSLWQRLLAFVGW
jgi:integrase